MIKNKKSDSNKKNVATKVDNGTAYINMPIYSDEEDKIGIGQHALEIKDAISKGAQTIAITSDFGGGKSSLVKHLETLYSNLTTKFCYINLWYDKDTQSSTELHRSFIYQLGCQISKSKGKYIGKRISKNYGLIKICLQNSFQAFLSYFMFIFIILGFLCIPLYDNITSKVLSFEWFVNNHVNCGIVFFVVALLIGVFLLYTADIVFSSKQSACNREIDEHELMDIYKSYICRFHFRHYIVIIEDLDRTENENVLKFIKELRRYYVPTTKKQYKSKRNRETANFLDDKFGLKNRNRITFIVNVKSETALNREILEAKLNNENQIKGSDIEDESTVQRTSLYPKVFDYSLNLKQINIDNYDIIMKKLLEDNKELFKENNIPVFVDNQIIPEFEWLKRGQNLDIRELKNRLNSAISTYINLLYKFEANKVSLPKCIASAYINVAFEGEYSKIEKIGFDGIINMYVKNHQINQRDIYNHYYNQDIEISEEFSIELLNLIKSNLLDFDYKQYFYNFPKDSYLHTIKENQLISIILYNTDVSKMEDFDELTNSVIDNNPNIIKDSYKRLKDLGLLCPKCIFNSSKLMEYSLKNYPEMVWGTFSKELPYDDESIAITAQTLINVIKSNLSNDQVGINKLCKIVIDNSTPQGIITFRREIINNFYDNIDKFGILYSNKTPLITKNEINKLKGKTELFDFINYESTDLTIEFVNTIQPILLSHYPKTDYVIPKIIDFYCNIYELLGETENNLLTQYMIEYMVNNHSMYNDLEKIIILNNDFSEIEDDYINIANLHVEHDLLSYWTIDTLDENNVTKNLSEEVCNQLYKANHIASYVANACSTNINIIDFSNDEIIEFINSNNYYDEKDQKFSETVLLQIRSHILNLSIDLALKYTALFFDENIIISQNELNTITDKDTALLFIDSEQIDSSNMGYIVSYLNNGISSQNLSYIILQYISSISNIEIKRTMFESLDFDNIQYYRISYARRSTIRSQMSDTYDFTKVKEQIRYMAITKASNPEFEKHIKSLISSGKFSDDLVKEYAQYTWSLKKVTDLVITNLSSIKFVQKVPPSVYNKMFEQGKYRYYVLAKMIHEKRFDFEQSKLDVLYSIYIQIFFADNVSDQIKKYMSNNSEFVEYILSKKEYIDLSPKQRMQFTNALQSKDSISDLIENYSEQTIIDYLSSIKGFKDYAAAEYYVNIMHDNKRLGKNHALYSHNYDRLIDSKLKRLYTRYYNH